MIIAKVNFDNKQYIYYIKDNVINVGLLENNKIKSIDNENEFRMVSSIFSIIKEKSKKHEYYDFGFTYYDNKYYRMFFDTYSKKRYFFEKVGNEYAPVKGQILDYLNKKFNSKVTSYNYGESNKQENGTFKNKLRRIRTYIGEFLLTASLIASVELYNYSINVVNTKEEISIDSFDNYEQIIDLIKANNKIDKNTKDFLISLDTLYKDNYKRMDFNLMKNVIPNLAIIYEKDKQKDYGKKKTVLGLYIKEKGLIRIFDSNKCDENCLSTLLHEYSHAISGIGFAFDNNDAIALMEGVNQVFSKEYYYDLTGFEGKPSYLIQQIYAKILFEIMGTDRFLDVFFAHSYDEFIDELNKYTDGEEESINLIRLINDERAYDKEDDPKAKNEEYHKSITNQIDTIIKKMFEKAKGYPFDNDKLMVTYLDEIRGTNNAEFEYELGENDFISTQKFYICSKLKSNDACVRYAFPKGIKIKADKSRFVKQKNGTYSYIDNIGKEKFYDEIPDYVIEKIIYRDIKGDERIISQKQKVK